MDEVEAIDWYTTVYFMICFPRWGCYTMKEKVQERRSTTRLKSKLKLIIDGEGPELAKEVEVVDISASGICFRSHTPMPLFREIKIQLELPRISSLTHIIHKIECSGVIVRCDNIPHELYDIAFFFIDLSSENKDKISEYIERAILKGVL